MIWVSIGSGNGLSLVRRQAIAWVDAYLLSIEPLEIKLQWNSIKNTGAFIHENAFENVVCKMAAIFPWGDESINPVGVQSLIVCIVMIHSGTDCVRLCFWFTKWSHERQGVSFYLKFDCLFNVMCRITTKSSALLAFVIGFRWILLTNGQ